MLRSTGKSSKIFSLFVISFLFFSTLAGCTDSAPTPSGTVSPGPTNLPPSTGVPVLQTPVAPSPTASPTITPTPTPAVSGLKLLSSTAPTAGHLQAVSALALSPDGKRLATGSYDQTVRLWDTTTFENREVAVLKGHYQPISSIAFSPDSKLVATGSLDFTVRLWEVATGRQLAVMVGHTGGVHTLAFSPDGQTLASGSGDKTIKLWHVPDGKLLTTLTGHDDKINSVAFSPDGQLLASGSGDWLVKLWRVDTHQEFTTFKGHSNWIQNVAFSPHGQTLASLSGDKTIKLWPVATPGVSIAPTPRLTINYRDEPPGSLVSVDRPLHFNANGQTLTALTPYGLQRWNAATGQPLGSVSLPEPGSLAVLSPDGQRFATALTYLPPIVVKLWQVVETGGKLSNSLLASFGTTSPIISQGQAVAISPDGQYYATGSQEFPPSTYNYSQVVRIWRASDNRLLNTIKGEYGAARGLLFSPNGSTLTGLGVAAPPTQPPDNSYTGNLKVWEVPGGKLVLDTFTQSNGVGAAVFRPGGQQIAVAGASREFHDTVEVLEFPSGKKLASLNNDSHIAHSQPNSVAYSPDGRVLAVGVSQLPSTGPSFDNQFSNSKFGEIDLWDATDNYKLLFTMPSWDAAVLSVAFSPDGKTLVSGGADGTLKFWQIETGTPPLQLVAKVAAHGTGITRLLFSPDGKTLATASSDHTIKLWDVAQRSLLFSTEAAESYGISDLAFSPDWRTMLSIHWDGSVKHWQVISS